MFSFPAALREYVLSMVRAYSEYTQGPFTIKSGMHISLPRSYLLHFRNVERAGIYDEYRRLKMGGSTFQQFSQENKKLDSLWHGLYTIFDKTIR